MRFFSRTTLLIIISIQVLALTYLFENYQDLIAIFKRFHSRQKGSRSVRIKLIAKLQ